MSPLSLRPALINSAWPALILCFFFVHLSWAQDPPVNLGVHGRVYKPVEPDLYDQIKDAARQQNVYSEMEDRIRQSYIASIYLPDVKKRSKKVFDSMPYTVPEDLIINGKVVARQGDVFNVLDRVTLRNKYVFLKDYQFPFFLERAKSDRSYVAIVIQGDLKPLVEKYQGFRIYMGLKQLIELFGITGVPSVVYQEGKSVVVEEVPYSME